jgi:hypothetical protein
MPLPPVFYRNLVRTTLEYSISPDVAVAEPRGSTGSDQVV